MDSVNHPPHYNQYKGLEVWDLVEKMTFNLGNAIKYIARAGHKDPSKTVEDLQKAIAYIERERARVFKTEPDYENYGEIVDVLSSQLPYFRATAVQYICRGSNYFLGVALDMLDEEIKLLKLPPEEKSSRKPTRAEKIRAGKTFDLAKCAVMECSQCGNDTEFELLQMRDGTTNIICVNYEEHDRYLNGLQETSAGD